MWLFFMQHLCSNVDMVRVLEGYHYDKNINYDAS